LVPCPDGICKASVSLKELLQHLALETDETRGRPQMCEGTITSLWSGTERDWKAPETWHAQVYETLGTTFVLKLEWMDGFLHTWMYIVVFPIDVEEADVIKGEGVLTLNQRMFRTLSDVDGQGKRSIRIDYKILKV
jgi:hypothetical protein